ncbi:MAG TPA: S1 RNA-binding domain-containing protein [Elusimicrobiales bacterium]|nr:S1 RNA-binding domain-containing protein [Elusimicrobiales bacterium]
MTTLQDNTTDSAAAVQAEETAVETMTMEGLIAEADDFRKKLYGRDVIKVKVVQSTSEYVLVNIGEKKEGIIAIAEFKDKGVPAIGTEISAVLEKRGGEERHTVLSHTRAAEMAGWETSHKLFEDKTRVKGIVLEHVKGGYIVDVNGVRAFMPLSLSELRPAFKHHLPPGAKIRCVIIEFSREKKRMIASRRLVLEEDEKARMGTVLEGIKLRDILRVVVSKVGKDRLFLRYHGIEGVVPMEEVAWRNNEEALKTFRRGQRIKAKLISIDKDKPQLDFSLKQLYPNPAEVLRRKFQPRTTVKVKVVADTEQGVKVSVQPDVEGFIPVTELSDGFVATPGEVISALVLGVNSSTYTLTLSLKRYEEFQNRKVVAQYLKGAPRLTLGDLLANAAAEKERGQ